MRENIYYKLQYNRLISLLVHQILILWLEMFLNRRGTSGSRIKQRHWRLWLATYCTYSVLNHKINRPLDLRFGFSMRIPIWIRILQFTSISIRIQYNFYVHLSFPFYNFTVYYNLIICKLISSEVANADPDRVQGESNPRIYSMQIQIRNITTADIDQIILPQIWPSQNFCFIWFLLHFLALQIAC